MVSYPSSYRAAMSGPETHGPWGGSGGTIFDDGVYTGVWQINLTRAVGITSMKVLYDRHGQAVWGNKHGFSSGVPPDKVINVICNSSAGQTINHVVDDCAAD